MYRLNEWLAEGQIRDLDFFVELADLTALRYQADVGFFHKNVGRGALLYDLVARSGTNEVLEFGTGRGYGALSAAAALLDFNREGRVTTIDIVGPDKPQSAPRISSEGPEIGRLTRRDILAGFGGDFMEKIEFLTGDSQVVASGLIKDGRRFGLVYIDGSHGYYGVLIDLLSALYLMEEDCTIVFDDYELIGVRRVVERLRRGFPSSSHVVETGQWDGELGKERVGVGEGQKMAVFNVPVGWEVVSALGVRRMLWKPYRAGAPLRRALADLRRREGARRVRAG